MVKCDREDPTAADAAEAKRQRKEAKRNAAAVAAAEENAMPEAVVEEPKTSKKKKKKNVEEVAPEVDDEETAPQKKTKKKAAEFAESWNVEHDEVVELPPKLKKSKKARPDTDVEEPAAHVADDVDSQKKIKNKKKNKNAEIVDTEEMAADVAEDAAVQDMPKGKKNKKDQDAEAQQRTKQIKKAKIDDGDEEDENSGDKAEQDEDEEEVKVSKEESKEAATTSGKDEPNLRLFVGNLAWTVTVETLQKDFSECGEIADCHLMMDKETGNSRGIAFITFKDEAGVQAALKYDGQDYAGRSINVAISNREGSKGKGKGKGKDSKGKGKGKDSKGKGKGPGPKPDGCSSVVVKGLSYEVTEDDLYTVFKSCGSSGPSNVKVLTDWDSGKSKGIAFVDFDDSGAVDEAMKLSETELKGRCFFMDYAKPRN